MMAIPEIHFLLLSFAAGILAGTAFFGGLWWTVRRVISVKRVALFLFASFVIRAAVMLIILYFSCGNDIVRIACYMAGFLIIRIVAVRNRRSAE